MNLHIEHHPSGIRLKSVIRLSVAGGCALLLSACGHKPLDLMPTPLVHQHLGEDAYRQIGAGQRSQDMEIFYATNRPGSGPPKERLYRNGIVNNLELGTATVRLGEPGLSWLDLVQLSTNQERRVKVPLTLVATEQLEALPETSGDAFAARLNQVLASKRFPDLTIYVHGAKSTFTRSAVQGAQLHHFMARETAFIAYSWPSTGKFLTYRKDVNYAAQSAANLADLIEYLAAHTSARKINLLGYSAGAQVLAPALVLLRHRHPGDSDANLAKRFRLGEIYFAAADVSLDTFIGEYLPVFSNFVERTSVTFHKQDSVLKYAQRSHRGELRLGRPTRTHYSEEEVRFLEGLATQRKLDVIDMEYSTAGREPDFKAHGHWYLNPWVSSDAILQFLYHADPKTRGLQKKPDHFVWYFPPDYPSRLEEIIRRARTNKTMRHPTSQP